MAENIYRLTNQNTMTLKGSYRVGSSKAWARYQIPKKKAMLIVHIAIVPDEYTPEDIDNLLDETAVVPGKNLAEYLDKQKSNKKGG